MTVHDEDRSDSDLLLDEVYKIRINKSVTLGWIVHIYNSLNKTK